MKWLQSRSYQPGGKLFARRPLKFGDRIVQPGEELPEVSAKDHRNLWRAGHADHLPQSPYVKMHVRPGERVTVAAPGKHQPRR